MAAKDYYRILGVTSTAKEAEIRRVYRELARDHHPDRFTDPAKKSQAEKSFSDMTEAFNVLTDPDKRKAWEDAKRREAGGESDAEREAKLYFKNGVAKMNAGDYENAVRLLKAAIHLDGGPGTYHAHLAKAQEQKSAFGDAARSWEEAIKREPYNTKYYRFAGLCLEKAGMKIRARRMFESALKWAPDDKVVAEALARLGGGSKKKGFLSALFKKS